MSEKTENVLVAIFYPFIVILAILLLASVEFRASGGALYDTWRLSHDANIAQMEAHRADQLRLRDALSNNADWLAFAMDCLSMYDSNGVPKQKPSESVLVEISKLQAAGKSSDDSQGEVRCFWRNTVLLTYDKQFYESHEKELNRDLLEVEAAIAADKAQRIELEKDHQQFLAFKEMESNWYAKLFLVTPYDLLVLLLVMFMGALGGMVRLVRDYGAPNRTDPTGRAYFFIPLIGFVVAIGGYILAKTGLLLLSSAKEETSLSPFMISLVGIVSGLLAMEVIDAIGRAGKKIMGDGNGAGGGSAARAGTRGAGGTTRTAKVGGATRKTTAAGGSTETTSRAV